MGGGWGRKWKHEKPQSVADVNRIRKKQGFPGRLGGGERKDKLKERVEGNHIIGQGEMQYCSSCNGLGR